MIRLYDILQAIERDAFLRKRLALKGGTALNAFHLGLERLSVDIDLEYISHLDDDAALAERADVDESISRILAAQGFIFKNQHSAPEASKWAVGFGSALGGGSNLKIDLGYITRGPLFDVSRRPSAELGGRSASDILVLSIEDVIVGKLSALTQRTRARDLFDAMNIIEIENDLDMESVRAAFIASVTASFEGWEDRRIDDRSDDPHNECQHLMRCLPLHLRKKDAVLAWYKESIDICRERFGDLLALTSREQRFVDLVQTRGEVNADLLSAPSELRARIAAWPRLAWKCRSVRDRESGHEVGR